MTCPGYLDGSFGQARWEQMLFCQHTCCPGQAGVLHSSSLGKSGLWMCRKHTGPYEQQLEKRQGILLPLFIYSCTPKVAVWPEALMGLFECGFRECSGGFTPGQRCHWCERNFSLGLKVCVCPKRLWASCSAFVKGDKGNLKIISTSLENKTLKPCHTACSI